jgi:hypothetical protein
MFSRGGPQKTLGFGRVLILGLGLGYAAAT